MYLQALFNLNHQIAKHAVPAYNGQLKTIRMNILMTGGAGYIGCHTALVLCELRHNVVLLDNLSNSVESMLDGNQ